MMSVEAAPWVLCLLRDCPLLSLFTDLHGPKVETCTGVGGNGTVRGGQDPPPPFPPSPFLHVCLPKLGEVCVAACIDATLLDATRRDALGVHGASRCDRRF